MNSSAQLRRNTQDSRMNRSIPKWVQFLYLLKGKVFGILFRSLYWWWDKLFPPNSLSRASQNLHKVFTEAEKSAHRSFKRGLTWSSQSPPRIFTMLHREASENPTGLFTGSLQPLPRSSQDLHRAFTAPPQNLHRTLSEPCQNLVRILTEPSQKSFTESLQKPSQNLHRIITKLP